MGYALVPCDWKALVKMVTSPAQNTTFLQEYFDLALIQAEDNAQANININFFF